MDIMVHAVSPALQEAVQEDWKFEPNLGNLKKFILANGSCICDTVETDLGLCIKFKLPTNVLFSERHSYLKNMKSFKKWFR